jgi:glycosyltransferase A (GT-A) superfamily protein (DUF2064 family)
LEKSDCVIGSASGGGYYLIGLTRPMPELFQGLEWARKTNECRRGGGSIQHSFTILPG